MTGRDDSRELVRRATAGDSGAFRVLLTRYGERLLERIRWLMGTRAREAAESRDFLQGVFVEALESYEGGTRPLDERSFLRWLTVIARNNIHDAVRRRHERALETLSMSTCASSRAGTERSPSSEAGLNENMHRLVEALVMLDEEQRRVIELRALQGLRFREVARRLGRSENAARMFYRRSLTRLGEHLGEIGG